MLVERALRSLFGSFHGGSFRTVMPDRYVGFGDFRFPGEPDIYLRFKCVVWLLYCDDTRNMITVLQDTARKLVLVKSFSLIISLFLQTLGQMAAIAWRTDLRQGNVHVFHGAIDILLSGRPLAAADIGFIRHVSGFLGHIFLLCIVLFGETI